MADGPPAAACVALPPGLSPLPGPDPDWGCACAGRGSCHVGAVRQASSGGSRSPCALPTSGSGCELRFSASAVRICSMTRALLTPPHFRTAQEVLSSNAVLGIQLDGQLSSVQGYTETLPNAAEARVPESQVGKSYILGGRLYEGECRSGMDGRQYVLCLDGALRIASPIAVSL
jgi:hypothetical protein